MINTFTPNCNNNKFAELNKVNNKIENIHVCMMNLSFTVVSISYPGYIVCSSSAWTPGAATENH